MSFPKRGELYWVDFNPARGSEQAGVRPALIVQNDIGNEKAPTTIVAALSTAHRPMPQHVRITPGDVLRLSVNDDGLLQPSDVQAEQILTVSKRRLRSRIGILALERMAEVDRAIRLSLAL